MYLDAYYSGAEFPGGLAFRKALGQCSLDGTLDSLDRVDSLLDQIRKKLRPQFDPFLEDAANQNFLYLLCFYVGDVIGRSSGKRVRWLSYPDMLREIPDKAQRTMFPECFQTSATCITAASFFVPLASIVSRLFDEHVTKSVRASAEANAMPQPRNYSPGR